MTHRTGKHTNATQGALKTLLRSFLGHASKMKLRPCLMRTSKTSSLTLSSKSAHLFPKKVSTHPSKKVYAFLMSPKKVTTFLRPRNTGLPLGVSHQRHVLSIWSHQSPTSTRPSLRRPVSGTLSRSSPLSSITPLLTTEDLSSGPPVSERGAQTRFDITPTKHPSRNLSTKELLTITTGEPHA